MPKNNEIKFLVDSMLGKLARFLRIFGYNTIYANDLEEFYKISPIPDDKLNSYAEENNCIILTKDYEFYRKLKDKSIYLEGEGIYNYLKQLQIQLNLIYNFKMEKARCSKCNSVLEKVKNKEMIKNEVLDETYDNYKEFYQCINPQCKKIFWSGSHILDITEKVKKNLK
ncbi:MAG: Mut7-C RNAse domain-containing protein [Candidatus Hodarchaeota archaeon]